MQQQKIETRKFGKRRMLVVRSLLHVLNVEASPLLKDRVLCTVKEAKHATGLGINTLYGLMNLSGGEAA